MSWRLGSSSGADCAALWYARSLATRSVESLAALSASVLGMVSSDEANSAIASCSRDPCARQWASRAPDYTRQRTKVVA